MGGRWVAVERDEGLPFIPPPKRLGRTAICAAIRPMSASSANPGVHASTVTFARCGEHDVRIAPISRPHPVASTTRVMISKGIMANAAYAAIDPAIVNGGADGGNVPWAGMNAPPVGSRYR